MVPAWLHTLAIISLVVAVLSVLVVVIDECRRPQPMWIMNLVWPLTAAFGGLLALAFYLAVGRGPPSDAKAAHGHPAEPFPIAVAKAATHCGSGCALGDLVAEWLAFAVPAVAVWFGWRWLFADKMFAVWVLDFLLAFLFGIVFQYFTIVPMRDLSPGAGIAAAVKADTLSLAAWQIGMYGFMAFAQFYLFRAQLGLRLQTDTPEFWFMMQIAMLAGFATCYPVNWWLLRAGLKERM